MRLIYLMVAFFVLASSMVFAERAPRSAEELKKESSHIVTGKVHGVFQRDDSKSTIYGKGTIITQYAIEVEVEGIDKGEKLTKGDLIYVRCWQLKKHGDAGVVPGPSGHFGIPKEGDTITVYLAEGKRDPKSQTNQGFNVLEPNGFEKVKK